MWRPVPYCDFGDEIQMERKRTCISTFRLHAKAQVYGMSGPPSRPSASCGPSHVASTRRLPSSGSRQPGTKYCQPSCGGRETSRLYAIASSQSTSSATSVSSCGENPETCRSTKLPCMQAGCMVQLRWRHSRSLGTGILTALRAMQLPSLQTQHPGLDGQH